LLLLIIAACTPQQHPLEPTPPVNQEPAKDSQPASILTEEITYFDDVKGFLAYPEQEGDYPGVVMIHEWWGLNDNIKDQARELAKGGYIVLAVDLYDGKVTADSAEAINLVTKVNNNPDRALENMKAAVSFLRQRSAKVASLGWCFGGGMSLKLALNEKMDATAMYYGTVETDQGKLTGITWPLLGVFGQEDQSIKVADVKKFQAALNEDNIQNEIYIYPGVGHAFANPSNPGHDAEKTKDAWKKTVDFLDRNLK